MGRYYCVQKREEKRVEEKEEECIYPLSWSVHHTFAHDGDRVKWGDVHPPNHQIGLNLPS
jgi:hypothetical protein